MAQPAKPAWPRTPDGTTDWEVVFESPDTGLIPLIAQAGSVEGLRQSTTLVIEKLFTRRGDEDQVRFLKHELNEILSGDGDIAVKQAGVTRLLRGIKETRIEKARVYLERKRAGAAIDRRSGLLWKIDKLLKPKVLIPVGFLFVALLSGIVYTLLESTMGGPAVPIAIAPDDPVQEEVSPETAPPAQPKVYRPEPEPEPEEAEEAQPVRIWLKTLRWPLTSMSTQEHPQYFSVTLFVDNWDDKVTVCRENVKVVDRLYIAFNHILPQSRRANNEELEELSGMIPSVLNQIFQSNVVKEAEVNRYGQPGFKAATLPPYCQSPDKRN